MLYQLRGAAAMDYACTALPLCFLSSVRLSVCLSVTLRYCGHIGWVFTWKLITRILFVLSPANEIKYHHDHHCNNSGWTYSKSKQSNLWYCGREGSGPGECNGNLPPDYTVTSDADCLWSPSQLWTRADSGPVLEPEPLVPALVWDYVQCYITSQQFQQSI